MNASDLCSDDSHLVVLDACFAASAPVGDPPENVSVVTLLSDANAPWGGAATVTSANPSDGSRVHAEIGTVAAVFEINTFATVAATLASEE
jgi:hypothetical protein